MATEAQLCAAFVEELQREGREFKLYKKDGEECYRVVVPVDAGNVRVEVRVSFSLLYGTGLVSFTEPSIAQVRDSSNLLEIMAILNRSNRDYRFAMCNLDDDLEQIMCNYSMIVDERSVGPVCLDMLLLFVYSVLYYLTELGDLVEISRPL